jgi:hypothetical protein
MGLPAHASESGRVSRWSRAAAGRARYGGAHRAAAARSSSAALEAHRKISHCRRIFSSGPRGQSTDPALCASRRGLTAVISRRRRPPKVPSSGCLERGNFASAAQAAVRERIFLFMRRVRGTAATLRRLRRGGFRLPLRRTNTCREGKRPTALARLYLLPPTVTAAAGAGSGRRSRSCVCCAESSPATVKGFKTRFTRGSVLVHEAAKQVAAFDLPVSLRVGVRLWCPDRCVDHLVIPSLRKTSSKAAQNLLSRS